jgi:hypothetical protein
MAEDASATTQNPTPPRIDNGSGPKAAAPPRNKPEEQAKLLPEANTDPMRELLEHLERAQPLIANLDRSLAETIQTLTRQGADPERCAEPAFRHQVAYAVQDLEKSAIWPIAMAPELRSEMTRLAATAPGLENERMGALMRATALLEDKRLIRDLREVGTEIGRQTDKTRRASRARSRPSRTGSDSRAAPRSRNRICGTWLQNGRKEWTPPAVPTHRDGTTQPYSEAPGSGRRILKRHSIRSSVACGQTQRGGKPLGLSC